MGKYNEAWDINVTSKNTQLQAQAYLMAELGMDEEQILGILSTLAAPLKATLASVENAYKENNLVEISETAHSLKGALLNLGLNDLADIAKSIEKSRSHQHNTLPERLILLQTSLQPLLDLNPSD